MLQIKLLESTHSFSANTYLVTAGNESAIVDPAVPFTPSLTDTEVKYILLTHAHFDHILELDSWVKNTNAKVITTKECAFSLKDPMRNCFKLYDGSDRVYLGPTALVANGDSLPLGDLNIRVMETPGHTSGSCVFVIDNVAFVGDTVFENGGFGRYDLPTGSLVMLRDSINKILRLPDDMILYPGHGGCTTVKEYKNYFRG